MCRLCSHISPLSRWANDSASCTFDSRSDFTSLPFSTMPHSNESSMWKLWRAARFDATTVSPSFCCFATAVDPNGLASPAMLAMTEDAYAAMIGHAYDGLPDEACGLLVG